MSEELNFRAPGNRLVFVDNLRWAIIILVILHHVAFVGLVFAAAGGHLDRVVSAVLGVFLLLNQGWFMGAFFLLSGYFSPGSLERKGTGRFLKDRLVRLGIPILFYSFVLGPIANGGIVMGVGQPSWLSTLTLGKYLQVVNFGPLWFAILLLVFDFGYAAWRRVASKPSTRGEKEPRPLHFRQVALFVALFAAANYLIRFVLPVGKTLLGFPSLYDLPEYVSFFCIGVAASRRNWLLTVPGSMGKRGLLAALLSSLVLFPIAVTGLGKGISGGFAGSGHWQSAVYALWESIYSVGLLLGLIVLFRHYLNRSGRLATVVARQSFAVYVIHFPIVVILVAALRNLSLEGLLSFVLLSVIAVPLCFGAAYFVRRIPSVARVL